MKASSFIVLALAILPAISALAGCDNAGMQSQSQFASSQAREQNPSSDFIGPATGQKKRGPYWWVWVSATVPPDASHTFLAYCPKNYVVTGGGYSESGPGPFSVGVTEPHLPDLSYWLLEVNNNSQYYKGRVTEFAVCAPMTTSGSQNP
jgi:hypothetical protein